MSARFHVNSYGEYVRVKSLSGEREIIGNLLKQIFPGDIIMDVGANIGTHTILFSKKSERIGKVISIEPNRKSSGRLKENILLNQLENVQVFDGGLGSKDAMKLLLVGEEPSYGKSHIWSAGDSKSSAVEIKVTKGDNLVSRSLSAIPNVIKIDVEGYEKEVVEGLRTTLEHPECRVVMCEYNKIPNPDLIVEKGFTIFSSSKRGTDTHIIYVK
jgi:FkbM family methyltransferase